MDPLNPAAPAAPTAKVVAVSGTFDVLHSGHLAFLAAAREICGANDRIVVLVDSDDRARASRCRQPRLPAKERAFMCKSLAAVHDCVVVEGHGNAALVAAAKNAGANVFFTDGKDRRMKRCLEDHGIECIEGKRTTVPGMKARSAEEELKNGSEKEVLGGNGNGNGNESVNDGEDDAKPKLMPPRPPGSKPVVFVSGCYDLLHSGHVAFFDEASELGDLYVSIGSDANIMLLKHHKPMFPEKERLLMVSSMRSVTEARICRGSGMLDFEADLDVIKPDIFFVNEDGHRESKETACKKRNIKYVVAERKPSAGLDARSSTALKETLSKEVTSIDESGQEIEDLVAFPWRICLAGGWLDQPWVSSVMPGLVIVVNIYPHEQFKTRSGLATSTRHVGMKLWGTKQGGQPPRNVPPLDLAYMLFGAENPPGCKYVAGSQDALGLMLPGINRLNYNGSYWPHSVEHCSDPKGAAEWLEKVLWLVPLPSRPDNYDPLEHKDLSVENVSLLAKASEKAWTAINEKDAKLLGAALNETMVAWRAILPNTVPMPISDEWCKPYRDTSYGCLFSGCGGGFLIVVSDSPVEKGFKIIVKTTPWME